MDNLNLKLGIVFLIVIFLSMFVAAIFPVNVEKVDDCKDITYEEEQKVYGECSEEVSMTICDDSPLNQSCSEGIGYIESTCLKEIKKVSKTKNVCETKSYNVDSIKLDIEGYECSFTEDNDKTIAICDSRFDGNGDGICNSGESCMKFIVDGETVEQYEKNSGDEYVANDKSFFVNRASAEVIK